MLKEFLNVGVDSFVIKEWYTGWSKKWHHFCTSNINQFSKLLHCQNQEKICNNTTTKDPSKLKGCRYTLPCEMSSVLKHN